METNDLPTTLPDVEKKQGRREVSIVLGVGCALLILSLFLQNSSRPEAHTTLAIPEAPDTFANLPLTAHAAIVYDLATGETLFSKNGQAQLPLASLTKLLTVYAAVHELGTNMPITISLEDIKTEGDSGLREGETFSLSDLARLALTGSSNDGAAALARTASERANISHAQLLTAAAAGAHLSQTYAIDGAGLDLSNDVSGGYGSAIDMANLAGALIREAPYVAQATAEPTIAVTSEQGKIHTAENTNPYVSRLPGLLLSKTGYTDLAGGNLVVVLDVGINHPIAIVALGSTREARFTDVNVLVSATFAHFSSALLP